MKISSKFPSPVSKAIAQLRLLAVPTLLTVSVAGAAEPDWNAVKGDTIRAFYPGVASWEFVKSNDHGSGAAVVQKMKKSCADCHIGKDGEFDIGADQIIRGEFKTSQSKKPLEPEPIAGAPGFRDIQLKASHDAENVYVWLQWPASGHADPSGMISLQLTSGIGSFANYGCFIACHNDQTGMPDNQGKKVRLYGYYARTGGEAKPQDKLAEHLSKGQFIDLWVASFDGGAIKTVDEYVIEDRLEDNNDLSASGGFVDGKYTLVITRALSTGDAKDIELKHGGIYNVALALHDGSNKGRKHYVSFPVALGLSTAATITASKQ